MNRRDAAYSLRLARGSHTIRVTAVDRAGNRSAAAARALRLG